MGADGPTDVLSFPIDDPIDPGRWPDSGSTGPDREPPEVQDLPMLPGDVVICPAVAARPAPEPAGRYDHAIPPPGVHRLPPLPRPDPPPPAQQPSSHAPPP